MIKKIASDWRTCKCRQLAIIPMIVLFFPLLPVTKAFSQTPGYTIDNFTIENGLPNNLVEDLEWDNNNILWISTFRGIGRLDGKWVYPFTMQNGSLRGDHDGPLIKDKDGNLFFGDIQGDIYAIKNNRPVLQDTQYRKQNAVASPRALQLPSEFWPSLFTSKNRLFQNQNSNSPVMLNDESFLFVQDKLLLTFNRKTGSYDTLQSFREDISLFKIAHQVLLHIKGKGIFSVETDGAKVMDLTPVEMEGYTIDTDIFWLSAMHDPMAVQGTNCYMLTWNNGRIARKLLCDILPAHLPVTSIRYNKDLDILAVATAGKGIYIVRKKYLKTYFINTTGIIASPQFFYSLAEISDQQLMLPYNHLLNLNTGVITRQKLLPEFWSGLEPVKDKIYFNDKDNNVYSVDAQGKNLRKRLSFGPLPGQTSYLVTGSRVFYSVKNLLVELNDEKDSVYFAADFDKQLARAMIEIRPGHLVLAGTKGIFGFDIQRKKLELLYREEKNAFESIAQYQDYIFAANYTKGLVMYRNGKAVKAPMDQLHSIQNVHTTYFDNNGYVWFSTDNGILRTQVQALINYFNDSTAYVGYQFFGKREGMEISELNGGLQRSVAVLRNGKLAYPGINGVITVDRTTASIEPKKNKLFIDEITAGDSIVIKSPGKEIWLPEQARDIVRVTLLNAEWNMPAKIIEYRLGGHSKNWQTLDYQKQNFIEFQNLNSGEHLLEIRELSVFDRTQIEMHTLLLQIEHPWYKTALFKLFLVLLSILLVWGISAWRNHYLRIRNRALQKTVDVQVQEINLQKEKLETQLERLEKDYAMKNRLISMIGHDIITPLRFMSSAGNKLLHHKEAISQETYDDVVKTMVETGNNLKDMSTNMLNWIKHHSQNMTFESETFDLYETVQQVVDNVAPMAKFKNIALHNATMEHVQITQFREPIKNILFQLLSNAIKYCDDGSIYINSRIHNENLQLLIKDEGPGMTAAQVEHLMGNAKSGNFTSTHENKGHGFGYLIIKDMLGIVNGTMTIESERNKGTLVMIDMPVNAKK